MCEQSKAAAWRGELLLFTALRARPPVLRTEEHARPPAPATAGGSALHLRPHLTT